MWGGGLAGHVGGRYDAERGKGGPMQDTTIEQAAQNVTQSYRGTRREHRLNPLTSNVPDPSVIEALRLFVRHHLWNETLIRAELPTLNPPPLPTGLLESHYTPKQKVDALHRLLVVLDGDEPRLPVVLHFLLGWAESWLDEIPGLDWRPLAMEGKRLRYQELIAETR